MPSTTFHFPEPILAQIDSMAQKHGMSRNRYVLEACKSVLEREEGQWPEGFFTEEFEEEELELLREASRQMEQSIYSSRKNRGAPLL